MLSALLNENFDLLMDAPESVPRMRELILQLAVMGKLVPQDDNDEPAVQKVGELKPNYPNKWAELPVIESFELLGSKANKLPSSKIKESGAVPVIDQGHRFIAGYTDQTDKALKISQPVVVFGDHTRQLKYIDFDFVIGADGVKVMKPKYGLAKYYWIVFSTFEYSDRGYSRYFRLFKENVIPLPPLAEQKRIVEKVDRLMALCDELEKRQQERYAVQISLNGAAFQSLTTAEDKKSFHVNLKRVRDHFDLLVSRPENVKTVRDTILQLAVMGKLVPQDKNDEPASELLKRIKAEKEKLIEEYPRGRKIFPPSKEKVGVASVIEIPSSWLLMSVRDAYENYLILDYGDGNHGELYPRKTDFGSSGVRFVTAQDIKGRKLIIDGAPFLSLSYANKLTKGWAQGGDVLLTHNATVGRVGVAPKEAGSFLLGTSVTFYRTNERALVAGFLRCVMESSFWQAQLKEVMEQTTRNQVSIQKQAAFSFPMPPIREQKRIVEKVDQLMALCDGLEEQLVLSKEDGRRLLETVVAGMAE